VAILELDDFTATFFSAPASKTAPDVHRVVVSRPTRMTSIVQDIRVALRGFKRSPGFTTIAVVTLALAIGATTAIFSLLDALMFRSLPVRNPDELALVVGGGQYPAFLAFRQHSDIFVDLFASSGVTRLEVESQSSAPELTNVSLVSGSYFSTLGVQAILGRTFTALDDRIPGQHPVAVASYGYWQRRFGRDASALDRVVRISGTTFTVVGVAPPAFFGEQVGAAPDLWVPLTMWGRIVPGRNLLESPGTGWLRIIGRVRPGVSTSGHHPVLTETFQRVLVEIFGPNVPQDMRREIASAAVRLNPAGTGVSTLRTQFSRPLYLLVGAVVLVLLIACANVANMLLVKATIRRREIDIRLALGMGRVRLIRQLLVESLLLAAVGSVVGVVLAWIGREALLRLISADGSRVPISVPTDARLLMFVALVSSATAILFGLAPGWQSGRGRVITSIAARDEVGERSGERLNSILVVAQVAASLVLLTGAGLFLQSIANLRGVDLGFAPERLLVLDVTPQPGDQQNRIIAVNRRILERLTTVPGVSAVSLSEHGVLMGRNSSTDLMRPVGFVAGPEGFPRANWDVVGPRYFTTIGASLVAGRDVNERDGLGSPRVIAINEEMAQRFFPDADPIGQRLVWSDDDKAFEIVGVIRDVKQNGPRDEPQMRFYLPYFQLPEVRPSWILTSTRFLVRTAGNPAVMAPIVSELIRSEDSRFSISRVEIGPQLVSRTLGQERMIATLLVVFSGVAVGLACLGLYGLIAYRVARRTSEIGLRMALGAQCGDVLRETLRGAVVWIAAGVAIGIPLALSMTRLVQSQLFGLRASNLRTLIIAAGLMFAMGVLAGYVPARRAARVDPLVALRYE
jgi:predicted permease